MTRSLRKRHLILWVIVAITVSVLAVLARMNSPEFAEDQAKTEVSQ